MTALPPLSAMTVPLAVTIGCRSKTSCGIAASFAAAAPAMDTVDSIAVSGVLPVMVPAKTAPCQTPVPSAPSSTWPDV